MSSKEEICSKLKEISVDEELGSAVYKDFASKLIRADIPADTQLAMFEVFYALAHQEDSHKDIIKVFQTILKCPVE